MHDAPLRSGGRWRRGLVRVCSSGLAVLLLVLPACRDASAPPPEPFEFRIGVFIQGKPNDFWDAVLDRMRQRLNLSGVQVELVLFKSSERAQVAQQIRQGDWRAIAICAPADEWTKQTIEQAMRAGVPVVLMGVDITDVARLGSVGTNYYEAGRRAGIWYAQRVPTGEVAVVAGHPVPRAVSEFWEGFRHGLLYNRRVRARLVPLSDSRKTPIVIEKLRAEPRIKGIFLMGAEVAQQGIAIAPRTNLGVLSWRAPAHDWYLTRQVEVLILERPEEIGVRVANLLRNLSQGRGSDLQIVYTPFEWHAR